MFALAGRREIAADPPGFGTRAFRLGAAYLHAGILAIAIAAYLLAPDWMWMYWVDHRAMPVAVVVLAFAMYELAFVAGFAIAPAFERARARGGIALAVAAGAALVAGQVAARARLLRVGTFAEYHAGRARDAISFDPFAVDELAIVVLGAGVASLAALVALLARVSRGTPPRMLPPC